MLEQLFERTNIHFIVYATKFDLFFNQKMTFTVKGNLLYFILEFFQVKWFTVSEVGKIIAGTMIV